MVSKAEVLEADWQLLRIELAEQSEYEDVEAFEGYSRFWCKKAVLGAYWIAERVDTTRVRIHLTEDVVLEGFREDLDFTPDKEFLRELLSRCQWEEVVRQIFPDDDGGQLSLFEEDDDG